MRLHLRSSIDSSKQYIVRPSYAVDVKASLTNLRSVPVVKFPIDNLVCMPAQARNVMLSGVFALLLGSVLSASSVRIQGLVSER